MRQSRPDSGLGSQVKNLKTSRVVPSSLERGAHNCLDVLKKNAWDSFYKIQGPPFIVLANELVPEKVSERSGWGSAVPLVHSRLKKYVLFNQFFH